MDNQYIDGLMPDLKHIDFRDKDERVRDIVLYHLDRLQRMVKIEGGTSNIPNWRALQMIMQQGKGFFAPHEGKLHLLMGNFGGKPDENYLPTEFVFGNPALDWSGNIPLKDGVVWKCDSKMQGFIPLLTKYATLMAENDLSTYIALITTRATSLIQAANGGDAEAGRQFLEDLEAGNLGVLLGQNILNGIKVQPYAGTNTQLTNNIEMAQYLKASLFNELGLDANYNMKREAINSTEAQMNSDALLPLVHDFFQCAEEALNEVNEKFAEYLDLGPYTIDWNSAWKINEQEIEATVDSEEAQAALAEAEAENAEEAPAEDTENIVEEKEVEDNDN